MNRCEGKAESRKQKAESRKGLFGNHEKHTNQHHGITGISSRSLGVVSSNFADEAPSIRMPYGEGTIKQFNASFRRLFQTDRYRVPGGTWAKIHRRKQK